MKSCLKTPPTTPAGSIPCTPGGSGCGTPATASTSLHCLHKRVSFCQKDSGLEEFFEADDWDRTPAPVAPKLSYEYVFPSDSIILRFVCFSPLCLSCAGSSSRRMMSLLEPSHICITTKRGNMCVFWRRSLQARVVSIRDYAAAFTKRFIPHILFSETDLSVSSRASLCSLCQPDD